MNNVDIVQIFLEFLDKYCIGLFVWNSDQSGDSESHHDTNDNQNILDNREPEFYNFFDNADTILYFPDIKF